MVESLIFIGAGAGAGEKNTRSRNRSKTDRLRNTALEWGQFELDLIFCICIKYFNKLSK